VEADMLKNVVLHSVATALANIVFPVPGGPNRSNPFQGVKSPENSSGYFTGITTASLSNLLALFVIDVQTNDYLV
jgi:hypothetical protein